MRHARRLHVHVSALLLAGFAAGTALAAPAPLGPGAPRLDVSGADGTWFPVAQDFNVVADLGPREGHTIVFDSVHQQFIAFGGVGASGPKNDVWVHGVGGNTAWVPLSVVGPAPLARFQHSAVFDSLAQRMIVFGGQAGGLLADVWQLDLSSSKPAWSPIATQGTAPSHRAAHSAVFDLGRRRMVVFGGRTPTVSNETWFLDFTTTPPTWQLATFAAPVPDPRSGHAAILDAPHDRMLIYGGVGNVPFGDVWALPLGGPEWIPIPTSNGPDLPREGVCAGYDPTANRMLVTSGDLWSLDLASGSWTSSPSNPQPGLRTFAAFSLDGSGQHGIFHGGFTTTYAGDTWLLTASGAPQWSAVPASFPPAQPIALRYGSGAIYDPLRDRLVMTGGGIQAVGLQLLGDVAKFGVGTDAGWMDVLASAGFGPRIGHGAVYDPVRDRILVFGGYNGSFLHDTWLVSLAPTVSVSPVSPGGFQPGIRDFFAAVYDPVRDRVVIYGGNENGTPLGNVWALSLSPSLVWTQIVPAPGPSPAPRMLHDAIYDPYGDRLLVFGGFDGNGARNDLWALSLGGTPTWTQLAPAGPLPSPRFGYSLEIDPSRQRAILFGGAPYPAVTAFNDAWALSLGAQPLAWHPLAPDGVAPSGRYGHLGVYDPTHDRLLVSGGYRASTLQDAWSLQFAPDFVTATTIALLSSEVRSDGVTLKWELSGDAATYVRLERRDDAHDWRTIETGPVSGSFVTLSDRDVAPGGHYAYRLTAIAGRDVSTSSEVWIDVPAGPSFSLRGFSPNPATREARVAFSLAGRTTATIELIDVGGRRVAARRIEAPVPGAQWIAISPPGGIPPGLYFVRLTQGSRTLVTRGTVMR